MSIQITTIILSLTFFSFAELAFAKRDQRRGVNFGTTMKLVDTDDRRFAVADSGTDSHTQRESQSFTPYVAYAFEGVFNLGLALTLQETSDRIVDTNKETQEQSERNVDSSLQASSLFVRLLFGKIMFFEVGGGLYSESVSARNEKKVSLGNGEFQGANEQSKTKNMGIGYHGAIGVEVPMDGGFYFTSAYITRIYQLREVKGKDVGTKTGYQQNRELNFGLAYYY